MRVHRMGDRDKLQTGLAVGVLASEGAGGSFDGRERVAGSVAGCVG